VALEIPAINSIPVPLPNAILELIRSAAENESGLIDVNGYPDVVEDSSGDITGGAVEVDVVGAEAAYVERVPAWLLERFSCDRENVACADAASDASSEQFELGAYLVMHKVAAPIAAGDGREFAVLLAMENEVAQFSRADDPFAGASRTFVTRPGSQIIAAFRSSGSTLQRRSTQGRSMWDSDELYTLVPATELPNFPLRWDVLVRIESGGTTSLDAIRATSVGALRPWEANANIFIDDFRDFDGGG
jgi:hypothetical protein